MGIWLLISKTNHINKINISQFHIGFRILCSTNDLVYTKKSNLY